MNVALITVPTIVTAILSYVFQDVKGLLENVPGLRPTDSTHDDGLRLVYAALAFLIVTGYALYTGGVPVSIDAAGQLLLSGLVTAGVMTGVAHIVYTKLSGGGGASSAPVASSPSPAPVTVPAPADFPVGAPSGTFGLPTPPASS